MVFSIIDSANSRTNLPDCYLEEHHIIPESFYKGSKRNNQSIGWLDGDPNTRSNLVLLTIREHRLCHILLTRMVIGVAQIKMLRAAKFILDVSNKLHGISKGKLYEQIKIQSRKDNSLLHKGKIRSNAELDKQQKTRELRGLNVPLSTEHKINISNSMKGYVKSSECIDKFKLTMKSKSYKRSPESNAKMLETRRAKAANNKTK